MKTEVPLSHSLITGSEPLGRSYKFSERSTCLPLGKALKERPFELVPVQGEIKAKSAASFCFFCARFSEILTCA